MIEKKTVSKTKSLLVPISNESKGKLFSELKDRVQRYDDPKNCLSFLVRFQAILPIL